MKILLRVFCVLWIGFSYSTAFAEKVIVIPLLGGAVGDARPPHVLEGKTFSSNAGEGLTGTLNVNGIVEEVDPTVVEWVKDGVSWSEVLGIPAGFADGTDHTGITSESAPQVGTNTANYVPRWNGSTLVKGSLFDNGYRIGLGTSTPNEQLELTGNLRLPKTGIIRSGTATLLHSYGNYNFFAGEFAGNLNMTGIHNTASGYKALYSNTTGISNTASGSFALHSNTTANTKTATGYSALRENTTGVRNTASGLYAGETNITGHYNTYIGALADADGGRRRK